MVPSLVDHGYQIRIVLHILQAMNRLAMAGGISVDFLHQCVNVCAGQETTVRSLNMGNPTG